MKLKRRKLTTPYRQTQMKLKMSSGSFIFTRMESKVIKTWWGDLMEIFGTGQNHFGPFGTMCNHLRPFQTIWNNLGPLETLWVNLWNINNIKINHISWNVMFIFPLPGSFRQRDNKRCSIIQSIKNIKQDNVFDKKQTLSKFFFSNLK